MKNFIVFISVIMFVAGCATPYKPFAHNGGYIDKKLGADRFQVVFKGNRHTSREKAVSFNLRRCAEVALENNFKYFRIVDSKAYVESVEYKAPTSDKIDTYDTGISNTDRIYGGDPGIASGREMTYFFSKPVVSNTIVCFNDLSEVKDMVYYDAAVVLKKH